MLQLVTAGYSWLQPDTAGYSRIQLDTAGYSRLQLVTIGYSRLQLDTAGHSREIILESFLRYGCYCATLLRFQSVVTAVTAVHRSVLQLYRSFDKFVFTG